MSLILYIIFFFILKKIIYQYGYFGSTTKPMLLKSQYAKLCYQNLKLMLNTKYFAYTWYIYLNTNIFLLQRRHTPPKKKDIPYYSNCFAYIISFLSSQQPYEIENSYSCHFYKQEN